MKRKVIQFDARKSRGRAVQPSTVHIYRSGLMRLSPDLVVAPCFEVGVALNGISGRIVLTQAAEGTVGAYKVWKSNSGARSYLISLVGPLRRVCADVSKLSGKYKATYSRPLRTVVVDLRKKVA